MIHLLSDTKPKLRPLNAKARHDMKREYNSIKSDTPNYPLIPLLNDLAEKYGTSYRQAYDVCV